MTDSVKPLPLPDGFNPEAHMIAQRVNDRTYHGVVPTVRFASTLVANGTRPDLKRAESMLNAVLDCQERRAGDPHFGNFLWEREDETVEDLNAVQFVLFNLIPLLIRYPDRLSTELKDRCRESIRFGLEAIKKIDVHPTYTNIVLKDITNSCLGGELLNSDEFSQRGYDKFVAWMNLTDKNGVPSEFNSPTYAPIAIDVLSCLVDLIEHRETRLRARLMLNRLGLSAGLHLHPGTGRWAGPYSRAYRPTVYGETPSEVNTFKAWIDSGTLPGWMDDLLTDLIEPMEITETADAKKGVGLTTYHSPSFALGVASQELTTQANRFIALQSNVFITHYTIPGPERSGVFFSRYILDDKWIGDFQTTPSRVANQLLPEEGRFYGVQDGTRAIGLYSPRSLGAWSRCSSAKAALIWTRKERVDEIWIGNRQIEALPADISPGEIVVIASDDALMTVRPLTLTDLGRNAPIRLTVIDNHLVLEMYNYLGPPKTFWELAQPGSFYQGQPQCGFYAEIAERSNYSTARAFGETVAAGKLKDEAQKPITYESGVERLWQVEYTRDGQSLGLEIDLMEWKLKRRWTQAGDLGWPMLESPIVRQTRTGHVQVGEAKLTCGQDAAWLFSNPQTKRWVAAYHGSRSAPLCLTIPDGKVKIDGMAAGTVVWDNGFVTVEAIDLKGEPQVTNGRLAKRKS